MVLDDPDEKRPLARQGNCGGQHLSLFGNRRVAELPGLQPEQLRSGGLAEIVPRLTRIVVRPQRSKMSRTRARPVNTFLPGLCSRRFTGMVITWLGHARIAPSTSAARLPAARATAKNTGTWPCGRSRNTASRRRRAAPAARERQRFQGETASFYFSDSPAIRCRFLFSCSCLPFSDRLGGPRRFALFLGDVKSESKRSRELRISRGVR